MVLSTAILRRIWQLDDNSSVTQNLGYFIDSLMLSCLCTLDEANKLFSGLTNTLQHNLNGHMNLVALLIKFS